MKKVFITKGPGHHDKLFQKALEEGDYQVTAATNYPSFKVEEKGKERQPRFSSLVYNKLSWFSWGVAARVSAFKNKQRHLNLLFSLYDNLSSKFINGSDLVVGWPQVSLKSLNTAKQKGKLAILEHPMIHVDEWMRLMEAEYAKYPLISKRDSLFSSYLIKRMKKEYQTADFINILSSYAASTFIKNGVSQEKLLVTPLGINTQFYKPKQSIKRSTKFVILYAGRLQLLKGVHNLIHVFKELNLKGCELWLSGQILDEVKPFLQDQENIRLFSSTSKKELLELYQNCDVFVLPSLQESFGLVTLEAMACGKTVIASKNSGAPDIIEDGVDGFLFDPYNLEELKEKIQWCYENPRALYIFGEKAREKVEKQFTEELYKERLRETFRKISASPRR